VAPEFSSRDPLAPAFWDERFDRGFTPWDRGGAPSELHTFVAQSARPLTALVPGCGSAYELALMLDAGWDATAIDFSPSAVARAKSLAGQWAERIVQADFFGYTPPRPLDLIYEQAFLCALPRARWPAVAERWATLLGPSGLLAGYFFFDDTPKGPPFGIARERLDALLAPYFDCIAEQAVAASMPVFEGRERWMVWRRR
jgi:trans-aconitate methyltransferase